jgi:chaperonin GroEL
VKPTHNFQKPGVVFQPAAHKGLQKGVNLIVDAIRPTLGPLPRTVCIERVLPGKPPEQLDSGGTIARRILQIEGRNADMGAMFVRHMMWKLQEKTGDGTATAAVIFQNIYNQGIAYLAAGGNAMLLRRHLDNGLRIIDHEITRASIPIHGKASLTGYAETVCHDAELAGMLGEIFDILGPYGRLEIRSGRGREITREYVQGTYWETGVLSPEMILDKKAGRSTLDEGAVLATDLDIDDPEDIVHLLELTLQSGMNGLLLVAKSISDRAMSIILNPGNWAKVKVLAVKTPGNFIDVQLPQLRDLAVLTGGRLVLASMGTQLRHVTLDDFGAARRVWAFKDTFGITTGKGNPREITSYVRDLQTAFRQADKVDDRDHLIQRIGLLMGGSVTLWIGALSEGDFEIKKDLAVRTSQALRMAMLDGVVAGGGNALLACQKPLLTELGQSTDPDQRAAYNILSRAMQEPFRVLLGNAGYTRGETQTWMKKCGGAQGFDLRQRKLVQPLSTGLYDATAVLREAVHSAISSAALLLTTDVLVHLKNPPLLYHT